MVDNKNNVIELNCNEISFKGSPDKMYENLDIILNGYEENSDVVIHLIDFNFTSSSEIAIGLKNCNNVNLHLDVTGDCNVTNKCFAGTAIKLGESSELLISGTGNFVAVAGDGQDGMNDGENGANGGTTIICNKLTMNSSGRVSIRGGNGGDGHKGKNGENGVTQDSYYEIDSWHGIFNAHIATIYKHNKATDGGNGEIGGNGGNAGLPIEGTIVSNNTGTIIIIYGNGGNGGDGGDGGKGGNGHDYHYTKTGVAFLYSYRPGNGGNGGNGGIDGKGGKGGTGDAGANVKDVVSDAADGIAGNHG